MPSATLQTMADANVELDGIGYYTLLERPANSNGQTILLCHALMSNLHMWDESVKHLHDLGYATLRFDHVGHGQSSVPKDANASVHTDDIARHMHELVKHTTGSTKLKAVIGCSIGGVLALRYAMLYPGGVAQVISIAAPGIASPEGAKKLWSQRIAIFEEDEKSGGDRLCHATVKRWFPGEKPEDDAVRAESLKHVKTCSLKGYQIMADAIRNYDYTDDVRGIKDVECLIVAGSEDSAVSPGVLKDLSSKIPHASYVKMDGAGHLPPMQKAAEFNSLMSSFLEK